MEQSVKFNSVEKFKAIVSAACISGIFFFLRFLKKSSKPELENLVLILQVECDRNFDDILYMN